MMFCRRLLDVCTTSHAVCVNPHCCRVPQVCFITNPIWVIKTRLELQQASVWRSVQPAAAALAGRSAAPSAAAAVSSSSSAAAAVSAGVDLAAVAARGAGRAAQGAGPRAPSAAAVRRVMLAPYRNMVHAVREIAREEGFRGFYRGLAPSLLLVSPIWARSSDRPGCTGHR